ncbi:hypothetical protein TNCV_2929611 [Trichonephila clavipes]|nr:hypothetical protein TNCV_2929611 [Trichonephila clavipes]
MTMHGSYSGLQVFNSYWIVKISLEWIDQRSPRFKLDRTCVGRFEETPCAQELYDNMVFSIERRWESTIAIRGRQPMARVSHVTIFSGTLHYSTICEYLSEWKKDQFVISQASIELRTFTELQQKSER